MGKNISVKPLHGIFAFFKKPGVEAQLPVKWTKLHLKEECRNVYYYRVNYFDYLPTQASGILTIGVGNSADYLKYLQFCEIEKEITMRLGESTSNNFSDGWTVEQKPYAHITSDLLQSTLNSFVGVYIQKGAEYRPEIEPLHEPNEFCEHDEYGSEDEKNFEDSSLVNFKKQQQLLPRCELFQKVNCLRINLDTVDLPLFKFKITSIGPFSIRVLLKELCKKLNTCAIITSYSKIREGPFTLKDCIGPIDLYPKYLEPHLNRCTPIFLTFVMPHRDKLPLRKNLRI